MTCEKCCQGGEEFRALHPRAETLHFIGRAIWALHRLRQALVADGRRDRSIAVGCLLHELEFLAEETLPGDD